MFQILSQFFPYKNDCVLFDLLRLLTYVRTRTCTKRLGDIEEKQNKLAENFMTQYV